MRIDGVSGSTGYVGHDGASGSLIMDQRTFWVFLFVVLIIKGAGALSLDRIIGVK